MYPRISVSLHLLLILFKKKKSPKILIATLFTELYKSWFLGLLNELQKILRNFFIQLFYWKVFCWVCIHVHLRSKTLLIRNIIRLPRGNLYRISLTLPVITPTLPLLLFCWNWSLVCRKFGQWLTKLVWGSGELKRQQMFYF